MVLLKMDLPGHCYGPSKNWTFPVTVMVLLKMGPMGPRGLGPNPFSTVSPCPPGVIFRQNRRPKKKVMRISKKIDVFLRIFAILANVDLNVRLKIYKITI